MLPPQTTALAKNFVDAYDKEHQGAFRRVTQAVLADWSARGWVGYSPAMLSGVKTACVQEIQRKTQSVWETVQRIVESTGVEANQDLAPDLKAAVREHAATTYAQGEIHFAEHSARAKSEHLFPNGLRAEFDLILTKVNAEIDLFAARYVTEQARKKETSGQTVITYNLHGDNPRVNIDSTDLSINIKNSEKIFSELRKAIESGIADESLRKQLLERSAEMESNIGKATFFKKYSDFVALAANHMQLLGPYIPALTKLAQ